MNPTITPYRHAIGKMAVAPTLFPNAIARLDEECGRMKTLHPSLQDSNAVGMSREQLQRRIDLEPAWRSAIDQACYVWAASGSWPATDDTGKWFLWDRVAEAHAHISFALKSRCGLSAKSEESLLCWLLVDYWAYSGRSRWKAGMTTIAVM